jgi:predicted ribosome quality control (RQC) complex YloA/Tae2 family protein
MKRVPFDSLTLASVVDSLQDLYGGRIRHIGQPGTQGIVLTVYAASRHGEVRWLLDCSTDWARSHLISRRMANPPHPPAFCMTLRKYIEGGTILSVEQRGFDRILDVRIRGFEGQTYLLSTELMGRHSNIILISPDEQVLHAAKLISSRVNRVREVLPGRAYLPPPAAHRPDPRRVTRQEFEAWLQAESPPDFTAWLRTRFEGIGPFLAQEIAARSFAD